METFSIFRLFAKFALPDSEGKSVFIKFGRYLFAFASVDPFFPEIETLTCYSHTCCTGGAHTCCTGGAHTCCTGGTHTCCTAWWGTHVLYWWDTHMLYWWGTHMLYWWDTLSVSVCALLLITICQWWYRELCSQFNTFFFTNKWGAHHVLTTPVFFHIQKKKEIEDICTSIFIFNSS